MEGGIESDAMNGALRMGGSLALRCIQLGRIKDRAHVRPTSAACNRFFLRRCEYDTDTVCMVL